MIMGMVSGRVSACIERNWWEGALGGGGSKKEILVNGPLGKIRESSEAKKY